MKIYRANVDSRSFSFEAYGRSSDEAKAVLTRALKRHAEQTGASPDWLLDAVGDTGVAPPCSLGAAYRDGAEF